MERLTERDKNGFVYTSIETNSENGTYDILDEEWLDNALDRLAAIEDILGNEYDLDHLHELAQADREGRCVVLPATTVFELTWDAGPNCNMICPLSIDGKGQCDFCDYGKQFIYESPCRQEHIDQIGKTVFLSREEAEQALEEIKNG